MCILSESVRRTRVLMFIYPLYSERSDRPVRMHILCQLCDNDVSKHSDRLIVFWPILMTTNLQYRKIFTETLKGGCNSAKLNTEILQWQLLHSRVKPCVHTRPFSKHCVSMAMVFVLVSQIILQKSATVPGRGPWVAMNSLGHRQPYAERKN